jgi:hypothetical protein
MQWEDYKAAFKANGALDILQVKNTCLEDWYRFIEFLRKTYTDLTYAIDGDTQALPEDLRRLELSREHSHLLTIQLGEVKLYCPYLHSEEITFEFNPEEIRNEMHARVLFRFMSTMGRVLDKPVTLSKRHATEQAIFLYERGHGLRFLHLCS